MRNINFPSLDKTENMVCGGCVWGVAGTGLPQSSKQICSLHEWVVAQLALRDYAEEFMHLESI